MKLKKIEDGMVVHCNVEEEAKKLIKWAYECGFRWLSSLKDETHWESNRGDGIFYRFSRLDNYISYYYDSDFNCPQVIEFSELIIPEPKFKVGDIIKCRDEEELNQFYEVLSINDDGYIRAKNRNNERYFTIADIYPNTFNNFEREPAEEELTAEEAIGLQADMCQYHCDECSFNNRKINPDELLSCYAWRIKYPQEAIENLKQYKNNHPLPPKEPEVEWLYECYDIDKGENHYGIIFSEEKDAIEYCEKWTIKHNSNLGYTYRKVCRVKESLYV